MIKFSSYYISADSLINCFLLSLFAKNMSGLDLGTAAARFTVHHPSLHLQKDTDGSQFDQQADGSASHFTPEKTDDSQFDQQSDESATAEQQVAHFCLPCPAPVVPAPLTSCVGANSISLRITWSKGRKS